MLRLLFFLTLPLYVLDQATKHLVVTNLPLGSMLPVVDGVFHIVHVTNTGAAFGMLKDSNTFLAVLSFAALGVLVFMALRGGLAGGLPAWAGALLAAGILGNLTDRLRHGHVIDFLDVVLPWYGHWPAFNVADSCICIAAALFILSSFLPAQASKPASPPR